MTLYKYMPPATATLYLKNWSLRISPAQSFNDPFELSPALCREQMAASEALCKAVSDDPGPLLIAATQRFREATGVTLLPSDGSVDRAFERVFGNGGGARLLHESVSNHLRSNLGVICFTRTMRHPLMWSHYADSHRGVLLEFDHSHSCFQPAPGDYLTGLRSVLYSDERPIVKDPLSSRAGADSIFTKGLEWAYEQEVRLILPFTSANSTAGPPAQPIHLRSFPPASLKSITIGCRDGGHLLRKVQQALRDVDAASNVEVRKASTNPYDFVLRYESVPPKRTRPRKPRNL